MIVLDLCHYTMDTLMCHAAAFILLISIGSKTVAAVDRAEHVDKLVETFELAQSFNKEYVYRQLLLRPVTSDATQEVLEQLVGESYKDLCCSYAFSIVLHLRYTKAYLDQPDNLKMMTTAQVKNILFTKESAIVLAIMHDHGERNRWRGLVDIVWIFRVYTDKMAEFVRRYRDGDVAVNKSPVLRSHEAVENLFMRFVNSNGCKAHDPATNQPVDIGQVYNAGVVEPFGMANAVLAKKNKYKFRLQTFQNGKKGLTARQRHRFTELALRLDDMVAGNRAAVADTLQTAFGLQMPLVKCLQDSHRKSSASYGRLAEHIEDLATFHNAVLSALKVVFTRIVAKHLMHIRPVVDAGGFVHKYLAVYCECYNAKMLQHLKEFARCTGLSADRHLRHLADMLDKDVSRFSQTQQIDDHLARILEFQKETAAGCCKGSVVQVQSTPIVVNDQLIKQSIAAVEKVARDFELNASNHRTILHSFRESLLAAEVFVKFVKKVTDKVDFGVIGSFGLVNKTKAFQLLTVLEL